MEQAARFRPLRPADIYNPHASGERVEFQGRVQAVLPKCTSQGRQWAIAFVTAPEGTVDCLIFPTAWSRLVAPLELGSFYTLRGELGHRHGPVLHVMSMDLAWPGVHLVRDAGSTNPASDSP